MEEDKITSLGIRAGISGIVVATQLWQGPVIVRVGTRNIAINKKLAEKIIVKEVS